MIAIIEQLALDFRSFAPDLVATPKVSMYRIYRDTRFSEDKTPLKTHVAAMFPCRGLAETPRRRLVLRSRARTGSGSAAACTRPTRRSCRPSASTSPPTSSGSARSSNRRDSGARSASSRANRLQRVPRGYPEDHEAAEYLRHRQFLAGKEFPARFACSPGFYKGVARRVSRDRAAHQVSERAAAETRAVRLKADYYRPPTRRSRPASAGPSSSALDSNYGFTRCLQRSTPRPASDQRSHPIV